MESKGPRVFLWLHRSWYSTPLYPPFLKKTSGFALYFAMMKWAVLGAAAVAQLKTKKNKKNTPIFVCFFCVSLGATQ